MVKDGSKLIMVGIRGLKFSVLILLLLGIPRVAGWTANFFDYSQIDPDGAFAWLTVHHVVQALLFVPLFALVRWVEPEVNFGLGWGNRQVGRQCLGRFIFWFSVYTVGAFVTAIATNTLQPFGWPLTDRNIWGQLGFQLFLSGPSEELIFRAFAITTFGFSLKGSLAGGLLSYANLLAAVVFGLAHVKFHFFPFSAEFSTFQVIYAMVLGIFYGHCFEKSGSVLYPMAMHSASNVMMVGGTILAALLL